MRTSCKLFLLTALASGAAAADYTVGMNAIDTKGVGATLGDVKITAAPKGGVVFTPNLKGLPPGEHGFHVHRFANCGAKEKGGKVLAGAMAGDHWDPDKVHKHGGPAGTGHKGDLPILKVGADGTATQAVTAPRLKLADLKSKALMIHAGGDNYSDKPKPNGGGGEPIACGVIETGPR